MRPDPARRVARSRFRSPGAAAPGAHPSQLRRRSQRTTRVHRRRRAQLRDRAHALSNASRSCPRATCRACARAWSTAPRCTGTPSRSAWARPCKLGEGELKSGGAARPSILADALEAVFGAIFLDGGYTAVHAAIERLYAAEVSRCRYRCDRQGPEDALAGMAAGPSAARARIHHPRRARRSASADLRSGLPHRRAGGRGDGHRHAAVAPPSRPRRHWRMNKPAAADPGGPETFRCGQVAHRGQAQRGQVDAAQRAGRGAHRHHLEATADDAAARAWHPDHGAGAIHFRRHAGVPGAPSLAPERTHEPRRARQPGRRRRRRGRPRGQAAGRGGPRGGLAAARRAPPSRR